MRRTTTPHAEPHRHRSERGHPHPSAIALLRRVRDGYGRLTSTGLPRRFPIVQFPNVPLIVGFGAGAAARGLHGDAHLYARSVSYLGMTIWAYEELAHGVNWVRRLLGFAFAIVMVARVADAMHG